jgi:putative DNA primase/helicase
MVDYDPAERAEIEKELGPKPSNGKFNGKTNPWRDHPLCPLDLADFLALDIPPIEMLMAPWLPSKGLAQIYANRGIGKTLIALAFAVAIATGTGILGDWQAPIARPVLYVDSEMPGRTMQERLRLAQAGAMTIAAPGYFRMLCGDITPGGLPDLSTAEGRAALDAVIGDAMVVFLDNLSTLLRGARENERDDWLPFQDWLLEQRRRGRSIVMLHHAGKGGAQRGTSSREDVLDTVIRLHRQEGYTPDQGARFIVEFDKARGIWGNAALPFVTQYEEYNGAAMWSRIALGDEALEQVAQYTRKGKSTRDIERELGISKSRAGRLREKAKERRLI